MCVCVYRINATVKSELRNSVAEIRPSCPDVAESYPDQNVLLEFNLGTYVVFKCAPGMALQEGKLGVRCDPATQQWTDRIPPVCGGE